MSETGMELPGAELRRIREERGLTREEVSQNLRLSMSYLQALEEDDYERLPEPPFIKGYLRNYARFLGVPGEELAARFQQHIGPNHREPTSPESLNEPLRSRRDWRWPALLVLLVLLLLALAWWLWPTGDDRSALAPEPSQDTPAAPAASEPAPQPQVSPEPQSTLPEPVMEPSSMTEDNGAGGTESEVTPMEPEDAPAAQEQAPAVTGDQLDLAFSRACWIRVVDATGTRLAEGQQGAGDRVALSGEAPFRLTFGDAAAVSEVTLNGEAQTLPHRRSGQILRLTLP